MKTSITSLLLSALFLTAVAQTRPNLREEIAQNPQLAANQGAVYPTPTAVLTPAPEGYQPFYINHYGRHGSRFDWGYKEPMVTLQKAHDLGKLTPLGQQTLRQVCMLYEESKGREGELTPLGAEQHRGIAARMYRNFPEVLAHPQATIEARSTIVIRCILSMENALQELSRLNPQLTIRHDASEHDMYYMNQSDKALDSIRHAHNREHWAFAASKTHPERLMRTLFTDDSCWRDSLNAGRLMSQLFGLAKHVQNVELRHQIDMLPLFTTDEIYDLWQVGNASWYKDHACSPLTEGRMPFSQRNLLRQMIADADSCLLLDHPNASLRYGHDGMVMPLTNLMELDGWNQALSLEELADQGWADYKIIPMACNIQLIYYKPVDGHEGDTLVKVLRNESEAHLPIATDSWPYYKWNDVRAYYLRKLDDYDQKYAR